MGRKRKEEKRLLIASKEEKTRETEEISQKIQLFYSNLKFLSVQYDRYNSRRAIYQSDFKDVTDAFVRWLHFDAESYEVNDFSGQPAQVISDPNLLWKALDTATFWKSYDVFKDVSLEWRIRFADKARLKMLSYTVNRRYLVLEKLFTLANGWIRVGSNCNVIEIGPCSCMGSFYTAISPNDYVVWMLQLDRVPKIRNNRVVQYYFNHYLRVIDFIKNEKQAKDAVNRYISTLRGDSDRWIEPDLTLVEASENAIFSFENIVTTKGTKFLPKHFSVVYLSGNETDSIIYDSGRRRWVSKNEEGVRLNQPAVESYLTQLNSSMLGHLADSNSCQGFIRLLEAIPNFRIRLTEEERDLIGTPGNVLAIGRSGTGKTTCALLRLFASEVLFKFRSQHMKAKKGLVLADTHFGPEDVDQRCGLHILFATASPVLTNEVKRFYWRLNDHIKMELIARNERRKKKEEEQKKAMQEQFETLLKSSIEFEEEPYLKLEREVSAEEEIKIRTEEEIIADDISEEEDTDLKSNRMFSMAYLTDDEFPLFLTIRRLVFMVDATQKYPFFARTSDGDIIGMTGKSEWHNEMKGVLMINNEYKHMRRLEEAQDGEALLDDSDSSASETEEIDEASAKIIEKTKNLIQSRKYNLSVKWTRNLSFEVDYDYFSVHFWPKIIAKSRHSPIVIWTEIASYIKGSAESHKFPGWYLPKATYVNMGRKKSLLSIEDKSMIWELFIEYERWKVRAGAYDFQDIVNYQLYYININGYKGVPIHYMMVDEVQDLTHATLLLVAKITEQSLFFSGDTAQTIAKGVGFRFCDLKSLFFHDDGLKVRPPSVKQLTVNFRSHGRILDLANSVVSLIEAMFPETIDKLAKEKSTIDGPKPMILTGNSRNELFLLLFGAKSQTAEPEAGLLARAPIEFGCDQVIIVRNQEDKDTLPPELKGALCLTVYEVKGLEFDDVLLYNFFSKSEVPESQWRILNRIELTGESEKAVPTSLDLLEEGPAFIRINAQNFENSQYSMLCTELKMLYVSITRPRKRLIIYDEIPAAAQYLFEYWKLLDTVNILQVVKRSDRFDILTSAGEQIVESIAESTGKLAWRAQGLRMMKHRFYEQAIKCFNYSGDMVLKQRAEAYSSANEGGRLLTKAESDLELKKAANQTVTKADRRQVKIDKELALKKFEEAGRLFEDLGMVKNAGKCYFSAKLNAKAAELFERVEAWGQCAEAYLASSDFAAAGEMFKRTGEYLRAIEAFKCIRNWEGILDCIHTHSDSMSREERETLIKKYIPIALEELMPRVITVQDDEIKYSKIAEKEEKDDRRDREAAIKEEEGEDDDDDNDNGDAANDAVPQLIPAAPSDTPSDAPVTPEAPQTPAEITQIPSETTHIRSEIASVPAFDGGIKEAESQSESVIDISGSVDSSLLVVSAMPQVSTNPFAASTNPFAASTNPFDGAVGGQNVEEVKSEEGESFSLIGSQAEEESEISAKLEVLSHYDPDDEWLQVEKGSIVESLHSASRGDGTLFSDYSIFDNAQAVALNEGGQLIKTKADIFVEDEIMRKILQYVSMFSDDVKGYLLSMKSKESLVQTQEMKANWRVFSMIDLDDIDLPLIGVTLDTLEYFELYKLCLVVCNRYQMAERLGRYVLSLAHKYSSMSLPGSKPALWAALQKEKAIVGYTALHNVFEMINPAILSSKEVDSLQSLGMQCFQGLMLMGYWKKDVYLLGRENALAIASTFADFKNYKNLWMTLGTDKPIPANIKDLVMQADFSWLNFDTIDSSEKSEAFCIAIDEVNWLLNNLYPITLKAHASTEERTPRIPAFPALASFNQSFWQFVKERGVAEVAELKKCLIALPITVKSVFKQTNFKSEAAVARIHDCMTFLTQVLFASNHIIPLRELIAVMSFEHFEDFFQAVSQAILMLGWKSENGFSAYMGEAVFGLLAPLGVRRIRESQVTMCLPLFSHAIVHRSSVLMANLTTHIPIDLEGDFILCPLPEITHSVSILLTQHLSAIVHLRDFLCQAYESNTHEHPYPFECLEQLPKDELEAKTAACLFGELMSQEYIQQRFPDQFPFTIKSFRKEKSDYEVSEREELEKKLKDIMDLGEGDAASMKYLMQTKRKQIVTLERKLNRLQKEDVESQTRSRLNTLLKHLIFRMKWLTFSPPVITNTARNWLLRYLSDSIKQIDYLDEANRSETMMKAYYLACLCRGELMMLDLIRVKGKPVVRNLRVSGVETTKKEANISSRFQEDLAWLDIQVYSRAGALSEAVSTIFDFFKCQFFLLSIEIRLELLTKAIVWTLASSNTAFRVPKSYAVKVLRIGNGDVFTLDRPVIKRNSVNQLGKALEWMANMSDEFVQAYSAIDADANYQRTAVNFFSLIVTVLANVKDLAGPVGKGFGAIRSCIQSHFRTIGVSSLRELVSISSTSDLRNFLKALDSSSPSLLISPLITVTSTASLDENATFDALDKAWFTEIRQKANVAYLSNKLVGIAVAKKVKSGRFRIKPQTKISDVSEYLGLTSAIRRSSSPVSLPSSSVFSFWKSNRAQMRIYSSISRNLLKLLSVNQLSLFDNVLDRHFVLNHIFALSKVQEQYQTELAKALDGEGRGLGVFVNMVSHAIDGEYKTFIDWTNTVNSTRSYSLKKTPQKKWDAQWKVRIQRAHARTGRKKQEYLKYRAMRIKGR